MKRKNRREFIRSMFILGLGGGLMATSFFKHSGGKKIIHHLAALGQQKRARTLADTTQLKPAYLKLHENGNLKKRGQQLWERMEKC